MPGLSDKQRKIVKAKVKGKSNKDIGKDLYPNATPDSAAVLVSRQLQKAPVQDAIEQALRKHNIIPDTLIQPIADGLQAEKVNEVTGEVTIDHTTRLKAAGMGLNLIGAAKVEGGNSYTFINVANDDAKEFLKKPDNKVIDV